MANQNLGALALAMMAMGISMGGDRRQRGAVFAGGRGRSIGPGRGPGSGRRARCKACGAEGVVVGTHSDGSRRIEGCSCG